MEPHSDFNYDALDAHDRQAEVEALADEFYEFPYDSIEAALNRQFCQSDLAMLSDVMKRMLLWVDRGDSATAKVVRLKAVLYYFHKSPQPHLAKQAGVTKQAMSKACVQFSDEFGIKAAGMRSNKTRERFSKECKIRHQQNGKQ